MSQVKREQIVEWLAAHEDDEHNALPHVQASQTEQDRYDAKLAKWANELLTIMEDK